MGFAVGDVGVPSRSAAEVPATQRHDGAVGGDQDPGVHAPRHPLPRDADLLRRADRRQQAQRVARRVLQPVLPREDAPYARSPSPRGAGRGVPAARGGRGDHERATREPGVLRDGGRRGAMITGGLYVVLLALLVVRVRTTDAPRPEPVPIEVGEPLALVHAHHGLFAVLLFGSPLVAWWTGGDGRLEVPGGVLFAIGVLLYRSAGRALGPSLSPLVAPRPGATLVTDGLYRRIRHPMYLGQAFIAVGAPLLAGAPVLLWVSVPALGILAWRIMLEDSALARRYPEFARYAAHTRRILPYVL